MKTKTSTTHIPAQDKHQSFPPQHCTWWCTLHCPALHVGAAHLGDVDVDGAGGQAQDVQGTLKPLQHRGGRTELQGGADRQDEPCGRRTHSCRLHVTACRRVRSKQGSKAGLRSGRPHRRIATKPADLSNHDDGGGGHAQAAGVVLGQHVGVLPPGAAPHHLGVDVVHVEDEHALQYQAVPRKAQKGRGRCSGRAMTGAAAPTRRGCAPTAGRAPSLYAGPTPIRSPPRPSLPARASASARWLHPPLPSAAWRPGSRA